MLFALVLIGVSLIAVMPAEGQDSNHTIGLTYLRADGNRLADGRGGLPDVEPIDIHLDDVPRWVVAAGDPAAGSRSTTYWAAALSNRTIAGYRVEGRTVVPVEINGSAHRTSAPPVMIIDRGIPYLLDGGGRVENQLTHAVPVDAAGSIVVPGADGVLRLYRDGRLADEQPVSALPDARPIVDSRGRVLILADPTSRYRHGVLGDSLEASSVVMAETAAGLKIRRIVHLRTGVIEGIAPIWADLDGDGRSEILVTVSDADTGARFVAFDERGTIVAQGEPVGSGFRWRHQIAVGPFGPDGEIEIVGVRTPHIGGVVEFYRVVGRSLRIVATVAGVSSHRIGSRNLDVAAAGDFDGDQTPELLVPDRSFTRLIGVDRTRDGARMEWSVRVGARVTTNLAAAATAEGDLYVGVGRNDAVLRIWPSR